MDFYHALLLLLSIYLPIYDRRNFDNNNNSNNNNNNKLYYFTEIKKSTNHLLIFLDYLLGKKNIGFDFFVKSHINLGGLFNAKAILVEKQLRCYLTHSSHKEVHAFSKFISQKRNGIVRLEFELAYYDITVQCVSHCFTKSIETS